jgi:arylsulfatase A-like enzyme
LFHRFNYIVQGLMRCAAVECNAKVIMAGPNVPVGECKTPVSTLDLTATFCDYAQTDAKLPQHGSSLRKLIETDEDSCEYAMNEWELLPTRAGVALSLRTVRTKTHKLVYDYQSQTGEMYDLENDPHELNNIYDDPNVANIQGALFAILEQRPEDIQPNGTQVGLA